MEIVGINEENIKQISSIKNEDSWVLDYRLNSYKNFCNLGMPSYGPDYRVNFDEVIYYKSSDEKEIKSSWDP